jgi:hypothetical protein
MLELMCSRLGVTVEDLRGGKVDWNRDKSKAVWSVAHEVVGFSEGQLKNALHNYKNPSNRDTYRPKFEARLRVVAPQWFSTADPEGRKAELLAMALRGEPRPNKKHPLGAVLCMYTNLSSNSYDPVFDKEIRAARPDWFVDTAAQNKLELKAMALRGEPKPVAGKHPLGAVLKNYTNPSSDSYDPVFDQEIRALAPSWFVSKSDKADLKKAEIKAMALRGEPKPVAGKHPLGAVLCDYTNPSSDSYDPVFDQEIRALRPDWFVSQSEKANLNKAELLAMALRGEPKPVAGKHPLGRALYNYTNSGSKCYDPVFDQEIRALAPQWFTRSDKLKNSRAAKKKEQACLGTV